MEIAGGNILARLESRDCIGTATEVEMIRPGHFHVKHLKRLCLV